MNFIIWAVLTSGLVGGTWVGIVMYQRQKRIEAELLQMVERLEDELEDADDVLERLSSGDVEEQTPLPG